MTNTKGVIYILTNPSFPAFVKIGYADNMETRLAQLNRTECTPFAFRVYATYDVESRLSDKKVHSIIDRLNPDLRAIDNVDGKDRKREFYEMPAEDAFSILEAIAEINGREERLHLWELSDKELEEQQEAQEVEGLQAERLSPFSFDKCNIKPGETITFSCRGNENSGAECTVIDNKHVEYDGSTWSLSTLAAFLCGKAHGVAGPRYFKYEGRWLNDIRGELEGWSQKKHNVVPDTWIIPCNPGYYDIDAALSELEAVEWKQSTYVQPGDTVFIYVASPIKALCYKCVAEETDLYGPKEIDDSKYYIGEPDPSERRHMRIRVIQSYGHERYPLSELKKHGLSTPQGPQKMPYELIEYLGEEE